MYVLGAGFSRAVHESMPLTDELGRAVRQTIGDDLPPMEEGSSFEDWLTLLSTPLPFLEGHANTRRRASAEQVTAAIAAELEQRVDHASRDAAPGWLLQLIALWHAERAVIITFNYDLLVERALTTYRPVVGFQGDGPPYVVQGTQTVYPAPSATPTSWGDERAAYDGSFQILKMHGSLNWYWAQGNEATLTRVNDDAVLGQALQRKRSDLTGTRNLDRFLIPPVTSKDSYYNVTLVHMLWREAYEAIQRASRLTIIGYSMPAGDRIAAELLRQTRDDTLVDLVNRDVGSSGAPQTPLARSESLSLNIDHMWTGARAVAEYVQERIASASMHAFDNIDLDQLATDNVIVCLASSAQSGRYAALYGDVNEPATAVDVPWGLAFRSEMPPNEIAFNQLPAGTSSFELFYRGDRLARAKMPLEINVGADRLVAIGASTQRMERWSVLSLRTAPASES